MPSPFQKNKPGPHGRAQVFPLFYENLSHRLFRNRRPGKRTRPDPAVAEDGPELADRRKEAVDKKILHAAAKKASPRPIRQFLLNRIRNLDAGSAKRSTFLPERRRIQDLASLLDFPTWYRLSKKTVLRVIF
jgi:hypothetical protein